MTSAFAPSAAPAETLSIHVDNKYVAVKRSDKTPIYTYNLAVPSDVKLAVDSACFFHPLATPNGVTVTDLAPADHPHHRGVFFGFVEMRGAKHDADFWGWGEHAPKDKRQIVHIDKSDYVGGNRVDSVTFANAWKVGKAVMLDESLTVTATAHDDANVLDLDYRLTPREDIRLPRWAFSGFCVRLRKDGKIVYTDKNGVVERPALNHLKPELDWPAADWYDATVTLKDGKHVGVAVVDHPSNPPCLWHNESNIHMLNPCIVAPGEVKLTAGKPLNLSYRLITHDGPAPTKRIEELSQSYRKEKRPENK